MKRKGIHPIVSNINKIVEDKHLTKTGFAELVGISEPKWNKISNGAQGLSLWELSKIAEVLGISICDIVTYPHKTKVIEDSEVIYDKVSVIFEVSAENRETLIRMVNQQRRKK